MHPPSPSSRLDAVLPLTLKDYERFLILKKSMDAFFRDLRVCWVVARDGECDELRSRIADERYVVIPETTLVPELNVGIKPRGWFRQQILKLAIAERVETPFYLTLDADVICTKPVGSGDLIRDGRAITNKEEKDHFPEWHKWAQRVLALPDSGNRYGVTPALLSTEGMLALHRHLEGRVGPVSKAIAAVLPRNGAWRNYCLNWKGYLLRHLPWTEYTLYYSFMEATGLFERHHVPGALYDSYNSVWYKEHFDHWKPEALFSGEGPGYFTVVQAKRGITPEDVWEKIGRYLEDKPALSTR